MLLPSKYENFSQNYLSLGKDILRIVKHKKNIYELFKELVEYRRDEFEINLQKYIFTLDLMYALGTIKLEGENIVRLK